MVWNGCFDGWAGCDEEAGMYFAEVGQVTEGLSGRITVSERLNRC